MPAGYGADATVAAASLRTSVRSRRVERTVRVLAFDVVMTSVGLEGDDLRDLIRGDEDEQPYLDLYRASEN
jgi:hypothetical protein